MYEKNPSQPCCLDCQRLALTKAEAVDMLTKKYAESISTFDTIEKQALEMADTMASGMARQFTLI